MPLRVAVISRHELIRAGLTRLLAASPTTIAVIHGNGPADLAAHDLVLYDLGVASDPDECDLAEVVRGGRPVVAVVLDTRPDLAERALAHGVADLVDPDISGSDLWQVLRRVADGFVLEPRARHARLVEGVRAEAELSPREVEVLELIATGMSNDEIARALFVSINTVKTYVRTLYRHIGVHRRPDAVLWALSHGLAPLAEPAPAVAGQRHAPEPEG